MFGQLARKLLRLVPVVQARVDAKLKHNCLLKDRKLRIQFPKFGVSFTEHPELDVTFSRSNMPHVLTAQRYFHCDNCLHNVPSSPIATGSDHGLFNMRESA